MYSIIDYVKKSTFARRPIGRHLLWLLLLASILVASGCARASREPAAADIQLGLTAVPFPAHVGDGRLVIQVTDGAGNPINDARLSIKGDMTHAGMVPVLAEIESTGVDGYYEVPFAWTMAGDWIVTIEATLPDGTRARERFDLSVAADAGELCTDEDDST